MCKIELHRVSLKWIKPNSACANVFSLLCLQVNINVGCDGLCGIKSIVEYWKNG